MALASAALTLVWCSDTRAAPGDAPETATEKPAEASLPVASDVRIAGDEKQTRFILDLDRKVSLRAFTLADPYRVVIDMPQVTFQLDPGAGTVARGLIKAFRYGMVMPGGSRMVFDLAKPAKIKSATALDPANGQPARMVIELEAVDRTTFVQGLAVENRPELRPGITGSVSPAPVATTVVASAAAVSATDTRPVVVIDPGHGGIDNGTQAGGESEKNIVLGFGLALRDRLEKSGKLRVVMTRADDNFVALDERVKIARGQNAALFVSIHADALPRGEGDAQGATVYTLSDKASDAEAQRLADLENKADAIAGVNLTEEPTDVADILIDLAQRETKTFSGRFARMVAGEMKVTTRMHKNPLKSAGFRVLKAPDVPSVLIELGYVSNKDDLQSLMSENWRSKTVGAVAKAIDVYFAKHVVSAGAGN
ncbi:N-acetylmuramoyl-L-alanine amidase [Tardiphaga alba]|uniref:N-acetylmuramoyl-L-alanine amidase n=2 Tax=Tardiphaga alba TaxID=340268 RepID=A0ABX8AGH8_9BRAD|nr:N-acetylmuramoyl-L-alanine amidase [Tardiphaga alba]